MSKTFTVSRKEAKAEEAASKARTRTPRAVNFTKEADLIAAAMSRYGFDFTQAAAFVDGAQKREAARKAASAETLIPLPASLAAAIAADYVRDKSHMRDFIAYRIASYAKGDPAAMRAHQPTIAKLSTLYGV